jgi:hypothetical protein
MIGVHAFYEQFLVGIVDHHGLIAMASLFCVLLVAAGGAGWTVATTADELLIRESQLAKPKKQTNRRPGTVVLSKHGKDTDPIERPIEYLQARRYFVASGLAGSIGLWTSAATTVPVLIGIGLGALLSSACFRRAANRTPPLEYSPSLWRWWGAAGCAGSLFFYLLEYFPNQLGLRLEVNHPLYAVAWLGSGELLTRVSRWIACGVRPWQGSVSTVSLATATVAVLVLPGVIWLGAGRFFWVADPFLWNLHHDYIHEFNSVLKFLDGKPIVSILVQYGTPMLILPLLVRLVTTSELGYSWKCPLLLAALPACVLTAMGMLQFRWLMMANSIWIAAIPLMLVAFFRLVELKRLIAYQRALGVALFAILLAANPAMLMFDLLRSLAIGTTEISREEYFGIYIRDFAHGLRRNDQKNLEPVVISGPTTTTYLMYYGGVNGIGTLYWENLLGLKATAGIYAAQTDTEAKELCTKHQATHLLIFKADSFALEYTRLHRGLPLTSQPYDAGGTPPNWLKPLRYPPPPAQFGSHWLFEIVND